MSFTKNKFITDLAYMKYADIWNKTLYYWCPKQ